MLGSCQEYFTKSEQALGQALTVPDALTWGSYSERLDDSTAKTHSSPGLSSEGGGSSLVQHEDTKSVGACASSLVALDLGFSVFVLPEHISLPYQYSSTA